MKTLQKNFTTPEQSKRLLELGVPADSADLMYDISEIERETYDFPTFVYGRFSRYTDGLYVPCWSAGRLIEIMKICAKPKEQETIVEEILYFKDLVELLVYMIEVNKQVIDFTKLEE